MSISDTDRRVVLTAPSPCSAGVGGDDFAIVEPSGADRARGAGMAVYDVIVLGVGGMGSAAAYHLSRRGARVPALEPFGAPHHKASSHARTRAIPLAYY